MPIGHITGMELAKDFYEACLPILQADIPDILQQAAIGLVGEGSECFYCDDGISQDHDFGPGFCLWLPNDILQTEALRIETALQHLPQYFKGFPSRIIPEKQDGRVGALSIENFYAFFTGLTHPPKTWNEWFHIQEYQLAACTNGEVFMDEAGIFSSWRTQLLAFYPRDVLLKKISARCMVMAQTGQYNVPRCMSRRDVVAVMLAVARFAEAALSCVFLCNKRYMPFYKWAGTIARQLPILGKEISSTLSILATTKWDAHENTKGIETIECFCDQLATHLRSEQLSSVQHNWMWEHGEHVLQNIKEPALLRMNMLES